MIAYTKDTTQEERGMLRAATEGVKVERLGDGVYLASSVSRPGGWHAVQDGRCDCEGFAATGCCKHLMATRLAEEREGEQPCRRCGLVVPSAHLDSTGKCPACQADELFG